MTDEAKKTEEKKEKKSKRANEADLIAKYPHVKAGSLRFDEEVNKQTVTIICIDCGAERDVHTSDLFQVNRCVECAKKYRKARLKAKRDAAKAEKDAAKTETADETVETELEDIITQDDVAAIEVEAKEELVTA